ncbi:hypothetical protein EDC19_1450 [Natranaerovirga hydrolytica]|uniref:Uncharacterized protein n=1 Tax=Natranaerovirga hydrolytica TaxID=680378 RepID=A0A4R1MRR2_9FIRM|nr:hypothetical protein [Natranaerovirga hydrolytica]TCK93259.1 hypothetical protein EDC19_1450 [Natranaerovirga hydrolytica]
MSEKNIYLVFSKTNTWLSRGITLFSKTKYVHTSLSLDDTFQVMYSFGRVKPNNPFSGGFAIENLFDGVYTKSPTCECLIYKVNVTTKQYNELLKEINYFCSKKECYRYNFLGLFGVLLNRPVVRKHHYFCTQFVSELLIKTKVYESTKVPALIKTTDLFNLENKELIYKGPVTAYQLSGEYPNNTSHTQQIV